MNIYFGSRVNGKTMKAIAKRINAEWILPEPILAIEVICKKRSE